MIAWCLERRVHFVRCEPGLGGCRLLLAALDGGPAQAWEASRVRLAAGPRRPNLDPKPGTLLSPAPPCSDEIYALSVFGQGGPEFVSAEQILSREAGALPNSELAAELVRRREGAALPGGWRMRGPAPQAAAAQRAREACSQCTRAARTVGAQLRHRHLARSTSPPGQASHPPSVRCYQPCPCAPMSPAAATLLPPPAPAWRQVHTIFGASKDFCASGLRIGCLHSRSAGVNLAIDNLAYFAMPSAAAQVGASGSWGRCAAADSAPLSCTRALVCLSRRSRVCPHQGSNPLAPSKGTFRLLHTKFPPPPNACACTPFDPREPLLNPNPTP